jgi:chromosome segregation ATPase
VKLLAILAGALGPWAWAAIAAVLLATHAAVGLWVRAEVTEHYQLREERAKAATQAAIAAEQRKQRDLEQRYVDAVQSATEELTHARHQIAERERALAALRLDAGRLRDQLTTYAAGGAGADPAAACPARAAALAAWAADLGEAAAEVGRLAAQFTRERDQYAAELVACVRAWPTPTRLAPAD